MRILEKGNYYGNKINEKSFDGILLSEYQYNQENTDWHFHENPYFMYLMNGEILDINRNKETYCKKGTLIFQNWDEPHFNEKKTSYARGFHIEFPKMWFNRYKLNIELMQGCCNVLNPSNHRLIAQIYFEFKINDKFSGITIETLTLQLCENLEKEINGLQNAPGWLNALTEILEEVEGDLSLSSIAKVIGVHPVHISRTFPKFFNCTIGDYIRQKRIQKSIPLLFNNQYSLTEISHNCGFSDQSHFTRTFRTYLGRSPKEYRKLFRVNPQLC